MKRFVHWWQLNLSVLVTIWPRCRFRSRGKQEVEVRLLFKEKRNTTYNQRQLRKLTMRHILCYTNRPDQLYNLCNNSFVVLTYAEPYILFNISMNIIKETNYISPRASPWLTVVCSSVPSLSDSRCCISASVAFDVLNIIINNVFRIRINCFTTESCSLQLGKRHA